MAENLCSFNCTFHIFWQICILPYLTILLCLKHSIWYLIKAAKSLIMPPNCEKVKGKYCFCFVHPFLYPVYKTSQKVISESFWTKALIFGKLTGVRSRSPGPSCSKLMMSLVNISLKLWSLNMVYMLIFLLKNVSSFCICMSNICTFVRGRCVCACVCVCVSSYIIQRVTLSLQLYELNNVVILSMSSLTAGQQRFIFQL